MNSVKRYNLAQNASRYANRTTEDRRVWRHRHKKLNEQIWRLPSGSPEHAALWQAQREYTDAWHRAGGHADFPDFAAWRGTLNPAREP
jgi:hypothetical protein